MSGNQLGRPCKARPAVVTQKCRGRFVRAVNFQQTTSEFRRAQVGEPFANVRRVEDLGDFVMVVEIKGTDWDKIKPGNVRRNVRRHQRQVEMYIDRILDVDGMDACVGIIYPKAPKKNQLLIKRYAKNATNINALCLFSSLLSIM